MSNPAEWNRLPAAGGISESRPRTVVPGIPEIRQPVALARDEWICPGCEGVMLEEGSGTVLAHNAGCSIIAEIARAVARP